MASIFSTLFRRAERQKTYTDLLQLDDHLLRDIGISRTDLHLVKSGRSIRTTRTHE